MAETTVTVDAQALNNRLDTWLQRAAVAVMVSVAVTLLCIGFALYGNTPEAVPTQPLTAVQIGKSAEGPADKVTTVATATSK